MEDKKQLKDYLVARFMWRIENFTSSNKSKLYSRIFVINEYRWRLLLFPKGNNVEYLSLYLDVPDTYSLPNGWSRTAKYSLALINQMDSKKTVKKETEHRFHAGESDWGFTSFFPLSELHDENGGYLVNDTCLIAAEVSVPDTFPVSTDNAKEIMSLKANFPAAIQDWRDSVQVKVNCERLWSTFEKTNNLLEDLVKTEEGIKTKLEELNNREKELEMQLEGLKSKSRQLKEERIEISKQTKQVYALAQEQSSKIEGKEPEVDLANKKLEDLKSKWASNKALFLEL